MPEISKTEALEYAGLDDVPELKPRVRFCWWCSRKLYGNHFVEAEIHGHKRILHKGCAIKFISGDPNPDSQIECTCMYELDQCIHCQERKYGV